MKFLLINKFHFIKGGSERYYFIIAEALKKMGHQVIFFSMQDEKNEYCAQQKYFLKPSKRNGKLIEKIRMVKNINFSKAAYNQITKLIENERPDIAILNLIHRQITLSIIPALKKHNVKIIWTMHDLIAICPSYTMINGKDEICEKCLHGNFSNCIKNKCIHNSVFMSYLATREAKYIRKRKFYNDVDLFICPSKFYKRILSGTNFTTSKIIHIPNPLPDDTVYELSKSTNQFILYFGRLSKEKGLVTLIESMENINYELILVGSGPYDEILKNLVISKNLQKKITFKGFKSGNELRSYIEESRAVVLPSEWYENGPYSVMEAMSLGKPLIVSDIGGLPELVVNEYNGYVVRSKEELQESIKKIISISDEEYKKMCSNSLEFAKGHFDAASYIMKMLDNV